MANNTSARRLLRIVRHTQNVQPIFTRSSFTNAEIKVSKKHSVMDEKIRITVKGLDSGQKVTLQAILKASEKMYGSCGHYIADRQGSIDTSTATSHGGTFQGVEPMGLFWSLTNPPGNKPGRLQAADVTKPLHVKLAVQDGFQKFESLPWSYDLSCTTSTDLYRHYMADGVRRIPVRDNGLHGTLFLPKGEGPFPGIIDLYGLSGGVTEYRSALTASHGIASFALGYVNIPGLPQNEKELDFNYFLKGFDYLANHPAIDPRRLGGMALCVGAGYLQIIPTLRPNMKCFVSVNGNGAPFGLSQAIEGTEVHGIQFKLERAIVKGDYFLMKELDQPEDNYPLLKSYQHGAKILFITGEDDQCMHPRNTERMRQAVPENFKSNCSFISYPNTGHFLEPPYLPRSHANFNPIFRKYILWGGQNQEHAKASEDSWHKILSFLKTNLELEESASDKSFTANL